MRAKRPLLIDLPSADRYCAAMRSTSRETKVWDVTPARRRATRLASTALTFGAALASIALLIAWMDFRLVTHAWSIEIFVLCVAGIFAILGIWLGNRLTPRTRTREFRTNQDALDYLGISEREFQVLELLASGETNKAIARKLAISPNTVKSHCGRLFAKLEVESRTQAIRRAREMSLLP